MFASWLAELIAALTPTERQHTSFAERDKPVQAPPARNEAETGTEAPAPDAVRIPSDPNRP
jgi:hypothetical protein